MPKETFYDFDIGENERVTFAHARAINLVWGKGDTNESPRGVWIAGGVQLDESGINRLIKSLKRARNQVFRDEREELMQNPYDESGRWTHTHYAHPDA